MQPETRHAHPYYMYEEILAQPEYLQRLIDRSAEVQPLASALADRRRIILTGCGTSFHTASAGEALALHLFGAHSRVRAIPAFELINQPWQLGPEDAVIAMTHAGETALVVQALDAARTAGALTVTVTGFPTSSSTARAEHVLLTGYPHEKSWAHTTSYTLAVAALLILLNAVAETEQNPAAGAQVRQALAGLPQLVTAAIQGESEIERLASQIEDRRLWLIAGTGVGIAVAQEAALKAAETHYTPSFGFDLEQVLHGYLPMADTSSLLILAATPARAMQRGRELLRAAERIGLSTLLITSEQDEEQRATHTIVLPDCPELLYPIVHVVPLQLLSYFMAVTKGLNPDLIRRHEVAYREARACYA